MEAEEVSRVGRKGRRRSPWFQFPVVLEVLNGGRNVEEVVRAHDLNPVAVALRKRGFLENGPAVFGEDTASVGYEKKFREVAKVLVLKEAETCLVEDSADSSPELCKRARS